MVSGVAQSSPATGTALTRDSRPSLPIIKLCCKSNAHKNGKHHGSSLFHSRCRESGRSAIRLASRLVRCRAINLLGSQHTRTCLDGDLAIGVHRVCDHRNQIASRRSTKTYGVAGGWSGHRLLLVSSLRRRDYHSNHQRVTWSYGDTPVRSIHTFLGTPKPRSSNVGIRLLGHSIADLTVMVISVPINRTFVAALQRATQAS
jgi:hypothetical protein